METPTIGSSSYTTTAIDSSALFAHASPTVMRAMRGSPLLDASGAARFIERGEEENIYYKRAKIPLPPAQAHQPKEVPMSIRIVQVFIADPNDNLPLENRVIYSGEQKLTDLTDQELFFEVPIADILKKHNETRAITVDKKQAEKFGRDIYLEPVRIRDLKMQVVQIAAF